MVDRGTPSKPRDFHIVNMYCTLYCLVKSGRSSKVCLFACVMSELTIQWQCIDLCVDICRKCKNSGRHPRHLPIKERGGGQNFSTSFWMRFCQAPLCRCRFKFNFDDIIFLLSGNIIEYICFWRFNSIIMTWNKWLVFTKSVIMGLNSTSNRGPRAKSH